LNVLIAVSGCTFVFAGIFNRGCAKIMLRNSCFGVSFMKYNPSFVTSVSGWPFGVKCI
jgi:hypothetical protein